MSEAASDTAEIPPRGELRTPFFWLGNEVFDVFVPIMGADCFAIYAYFARSVFSNPKLKHSVRETAGATKLGITTVSRSLEILEHLQLIKLIRFRGGKDSECQLLDAREVAIRLGAHYDRRSLSFLLPKEVAQHLNDEVKALRERQQGKSSQTAPRDCGNSFRAVSHRNASVSPAIRQRSVRETQTRFHLLLEERRIKIIPTPTPSRECELQKPKGFPHEVGPDVDLTGVRTIFDGVIKDIRSHLLDNSRPPNPHLTSGFTDWQRFEFDSMAVKRVSWRGAILILTLSANDPGAARRGLDKYHKTWEAILRKWYEREVQVELIKRES